MDAPMFSKILSLTLSLLLFICQPVYSATRWARFDYFKNSLGLNDGASTISIEDGEATDLQNVILTTYGSFKTRDGYAKLNSSTLGSSVICTGLIYYKQADGTEYIVGVFDNDTIQKMDYNIGGAPDGTWDNITGSLLFSAGQNNLASFAVGEDELLIEDGINTTPPYKWTGTGNAAALGGSSPNATMVAYHKRMAFAAGNDSNPSTLYFSDLGDIDTWTGGLSGNVSIDTNDGSIIRAIVPGFDSLYIWKDKSIWRLTGENKDSFRLQRMISGTGCLSPNAVVKIGNSFFFTDGQGNVYIYDGAIGLKLISTKIQGTIDNTSIARYEYVSNIAFENDFYSSVSTSGSGTHDTVIVFDTYNLGWTKFDGINANAMAIADNGSGEDMIIFGDYGGFVYYYPSGTNDAGTAINAYFATKQFSFPSVAGENKDWRKLRVYATSKGNYNLNIEVRNDFTTAGTTYAMNLASGGAVYGTAVYGTALWAGETLLIKRIEPGLEGNFFQIKFYNENVDEPFEVKGYQIYMESVEYQ